MSDHMEEQEMEAEALAAIFDTAFEIISNEQPFKWAVSLYPVDTQDDDERDELNHVGCILHVQLPMEYPDALPIMDIKLIKGLANEHREQLIQIANDEAQGYEGMPAIYAVCEAIRAWLSDNNIKGLDDVSMHAQMMRKQMEAEKVKAQRQEFESQKVFEEMTEAEKEELEVRKRRAEGTPCTEETFNEWKKRFEEEMAQKEEEEENGSSSDRTSNNKKKSKSTTLTLEEQMSSRITGYEYFTQKGGVMNLELLEKAAEEAAEVSGDEDDEDVDVDELDVDEDLFDDDDDLDDLDFDDDEEEEEYDEEEIDI